MNKKIHAIVAIIVLLGSLALYQYLMTVKQIDRVAQDLLIYIDPVNNSPNQDFLTNTEAPTALEVVNFLKEEKLIFKEKSAVTITGLKSASQNLRFELAGKDLSFRVNFKKVAKGWKIAGFPELQVYSQAIVTNIDAAQNKIEFLYAGDAKKLTTDVTTFKLQEVYFLVTLQGKIIFEKPLEKKTISKIIAISSTVLESKQEGILPLKENTHYYNLTGEAPRYGQQERPIVGQENVTLYTNNGKVAMVAVTEKYRPEKIRVTLNSGDFGGLEHSKIRLSSSTGLLLEDKVANKAYSFNKGETLTFTPQEEKVQMSSSGGKKINFTNRIFLTSKGNSGISVSSLVRGQGTPTYPGQLEVFKQKDNLYLLNELPLERYLYSVVASEMPRSFGYEALKVQAIAARSYALNSMSDRKYEHLGAHLDDSVLSQVFNNNKEEAVVNQAVNATRGKALYYGGKAIDAKFFSTSSGLTANAHEVWQDGDSMIFPGNPIPYLKSKSQLPSKPDFSLTTEEQFQTFFASSNNLAFDRESPWFRWEVELTGEQLSASIENNLATRHKADPNFILTKTENGYKSKAIPADSIGTLKDLIIVSRGAGGNITELKIEGSNGTYSIKKELNIRYVLSPKNFLSEGKDIELKRWDGSVVKNYALLPSSFFSVHIFSEMEPKALTRVAFFGGGNGHGVGMSQWGVKGMLAQRYSLEQILEHYYPETRLVNIYE